MSESKLKDKNLEQSVDLFAEFRLLKGEFVPPAKETDENNTVISGEKDEVTTTDEEQSRLDAGTKLIEENLKKADELKAAKEKAKKEEDSKNQTDEESDEDESKDKKSSPIKGLVDEWYNKGILDFNSEDPDFTDSEDTIEKLIEKTRDNRVNKWAESLPEEFNALLDYVKNGGKPKDFLSVYYGNYSWTDFKVETEDAQRLVIKESLIAGGEAPEDAEEMVKDIETSGNLEKRSKTALAKLQKYELNEKEELVKSQKEFAEKEKKARQEEFDNYKKELFSKEDLMGFKLTPKIKEKLWDFMTVINKKTGMTGYQEAVKTNKDSSLLFAFQAMQGFNIKDLEKQVQTKVSNNLASILVNHQKDSKSKISGGSTQQNKDENPFDLFKTSKV